MADSDLSALNKVRRLLGARGLTITDMAGAVGKSRPAIYRVLKDEEHYPHTRKAVAEFLGVEVGDLWPPAEAA